jgi:hypothetical protein
MPNITILFIDFSFLIYYLPCSTQKDTDILAATFTTHEQQQQQQPTTTTTTTTTTKTKLQLQSTLQLEQIHHLHSH